MQVRKVFAIEDAKRNHRLYSEEMQALGLVALATGQLKRPGCLFFCCFLMFGGSFASGGWHRGCIGHIFMIGFPCVHAGNYLLRQQQGFEAQWLTGTGRRRVGATQVVQKAKEDEAIRRRSIERVPCRSQLLFCMPSVVECCEC